MSLNFLPTNAATLSNLSITRFSLAKAVGSMKLLDVHNDADKHFPCHVANVSGHFHKDAIGAAEVCARSILMEAARASASRTKAELDKCMGWMDGGPTGSLGTMLHSRFAALGTLYAALLHLQKERSADPKVNACMKRVKDATVELGVKIGKCNKPSDGTMSGGPAKGVNDASLAARDCIAECMATLDRDAVFSAIAATVLDKPMTDALQRRQPVVLQQIRAGGDVSKLLPEVLLKAEVDATAANIEYLLSASSKDDAQAALLAALKLPDFVAEGDPGKSGAKAGKEKGASDLPPALRELAGDGKNVAVNYNDFGKMGNKSTVDGANAARLAELDVEKHRITIDGMLQAFKLGLQGSHGCGHLITGIRNAGGHIGTPADDPRHATRTRSIEIQADLVDNQPNGESSNREIHMGSITLLTGDEERLGVVPSGPDPFTASLDTGANAIAEVESFWMNDDSLDYLSLTDPSIERASQNHNAGSPDVEVQHEVQKPVADDVDLLTEFETREPRWNALRSRGSEQEDVRQMHTSVDDLPHTRNIASAQIQKNEDTVATQSLIASNTQIRQTTTNDLNELEGADVTRPPDYVPSRTVQSTKSEIPPELQFKRYVDARNKQESDRLMLDTESGGDVEDFSRWRGKPMGAGSTAGSVLVQDMKAFFRNEALDASAKLIQPSVARGRGFVNAEPVVVEGSMMKRSSGRQERRAEDANVVSPFQKLMSLRKEGAQVSVALSQSGAGKAFGGLAQAKAQAARIERLMQADQPVHADFPVISQEELTRNLLHVPDLVALSDRTLGPDGKDLQARLDAMRLKLDEMEAEVDQSLAPVLSEAQSSSEERELAPAPKHSVAAMTDDLLSEIRSARQKLRQGSRVWRDSLGQGWRDTQSVQ